MFFRLTSSSAENAAEVRLEDSCCPLLQDRSDQYRSGKRVSLLDIRTIPLPRHP